MEEKILKACVHIQRIARGFIARLRYRRVQAEQLHYEKEQLNNVLD